MKSLVYQSLILRIEIVMDSTAYFYINDDLKSILCSELTAFCAKKTGPEIAAAMLEINRRFYGVQFASEFSVKYGDKFAPLQFICYL